MKNTGIIRRVDDLGRIMIPKEIRRTLKINDGDPMEIFINNGMVCYQKYEPEVNYIETIDSIIKTLSDDMDINITKKSMLQAKMKEAISLLNEQQEVNV